MQMVPELPDHRPMGEGGDAVQCPLRTPRTGCQVEGQDPLEPSSPAPARRSAAGFLSLCSLLRRGGNHITFHAWPGSHNAAYWASHMTQYLAFYANALATCR